MDPRIQDKYVETKDQLADILAKGSSTLDEWNHLLHLLNIMNLCFLAAISFFEIKSEPYRVLYQKEGKKKHLQRKVVRQWRRRSQDL